jgi:high-affinity iron transporter
MFASTLITLREGLEAALIVGIMLSMLRKLGHTKRMRSVWAGVVGALLLSVAIGLALNRLGVVFQGRGEEIFEGATMFLAAGVLTWMIFWMQRQGRRVQTHLELDVRRAVSAGGAWGLFSLAFVAVVREGIETALFLTAAAFSATPVQALIGGGLGLALAVALGWLIFAGGKRLNMRVFFKMTGLLLVLFAAGLVGRSVHAFQEAALLPTVIEHVWDINPVINEGSVPGIFLRAIFGYNGNPSLLEVVSYATYFGVVSMASLRGVGRPVRTGEANA